MRIPTDREYAADSGGPTIPMAALAEDAGVKVLVPPPTSKLQRTVHIVQIVFYTASIIVILGGALSGLAMHFNWLNLFAGGAGVGMPSGSPPRVVQSSPAPVTAANLLAQDTFQRPDQAFWGTASDGTAWGGDANSARSFAIAGGVGTITGGQGFLTALLGQARRDEEVVSAVSISRFDNQRDNVGVILRWTDANNYYKAYIDGTQLVVLKRVAGRSTQLAALPFAAADTVSYTMRFSIVGTLLSVRAWATGSPEPAGWMLTVTDHSLPSGFGGLRVLLQPGVVARVSAFEERSLP